jgi:L-ascorbate peroxidase
MSSHPPSRVQAMGGPKIPLRLGRKTASGPDMCHAEGNLPAGQAPYPTGDTAAGHLRAVFHRMGLTDKARSPCGSLVTDNV